MLILVTHDQALTYSRLERLFMIMAAVALVAFVEYITSNQPSWLFTWIALFAGQILSFKCWSDMIVYREPFKNCWEFKE